MTIVKFADVVQRANYYVDKDNTELQYYVGGEHFDVGEFSVTKRGIIKNSTIGPMFYFGFKAGDFLIVSRNPHLKKAARVDFDGICSEKTFVVKSKMNLSYSRIIFHLLSRTHYSGTMLKNIKADLSISF